MLKIKDNVDLKELEKFGFGGNRNPESIYYGCWELYDNNKEVNYFINNARTITINPHRDKTIIEETDTLYDLIQANLVEKVEVE